MGHHFGMESALLVCTKTTLTVPVTNFWSPSLVRIAIYKKTTAQPSSDRRDRVRRKQRAWR